MIESLRPYSGSAVIVRCVGGDPLVGILSISSDDYVTVGPWRVAVAHIVAWKLRGVA
jgi:hypothetical protein